MAKASVSFTLGQGADRKDSAQIKRALDSIPGVLSVSVGRDGDRVAVDYDTTGTGTEKIRKLLEKQGFRVAGESTEEHIM
jgi:copper chaperone CopZ